MLIIKYFLLIGTLLTSAVFGWSAYLERSAAAKAEIAAAAAPPAANQKPVKPGLIRAEKPEEDEPVIVPKAKAGKEKPTRRKRTQYRD